jgi:hypothetical protein
MSCVEKLWRSSVADAEHSTENHYGQRQQQSQKGNQETEKGEAEGSARDAQGLLNQRPMTGQRFVALEITDRIAVAPVNSRDAFSL